jgi:hypothetical protein
MQDEAGAEQPHDPSRREPLLADLVAQLFKDAETLLLQEFALARAAIGEKFGRGVGGSVLLLAGIVTAFAGGLALIAALVLLLGNVMALWRASALVGIVIFSAGVAVALYGCRRVAQAGLVPRRTWQSLRETGAWAREELT